MRASNRIFEGTNEINRMLVPSMLVKRALKGGVPVLKAAKALQDEILGPPAGIAGAVSADPLAQARAAAAAIKKVAVLLLGASLQRYGDAIATEQEVMMLTSDVLTEAFAADSVVLRAEATATSDAGRAGLHVDAACIVAHDGAMRAEAAARTIVAHVAEGDERRLLAGRASTRPQSGALRHDCRPAASR